MADRPESSTRAVAHQVGAILRSFVSVKENYLRPLPYSASKSFESGRLSSPPKLLPVSDVRALQPDFIGHVLFTNEKTFSLKSVFNSYNFHEWATDNPHATRSHSFQQRFFVNVLISIVNDFLLAHTYYRHD